MTSYNKTYPLWANALALRDIAPLSRNVGYDGPLSEATSLCIKSTKQGNKDKHGKGKDVRN